MPKKFGKLSASPPISDPKNVVLVPSGATISGLLRVTGVMALPDVSKRIRVGPADENVETVPAVQIVVPAAADHDVGSATPLHLVVTGPAD